MIASHPSVPRTGLAATHCIFCGNPKVTKEHVWPGWISKLLIGNERPGFEFTISTGKTRDTSVPIRRPVKANFIEVKAKCVCKKCNTGWMSRMEDAIKPILRPLILGEKTSGTITGSDQLQIAAWCAKTAMVLEYAMPNPRRSLISAAEHRWFHEYRLPPPNQKVWVAAHDGENEGAAWHRLLKLHPTDELGGHCYAVTLCARHFVFQVAGMLDNQEWTIENPAATGEAAIRVWPPNIGPVAWPPSLILSDAALDAFAWPLDGTVRCYRWRGV